MKSFRAKDSMLPQSYKAEYAEKPGNPIEVGIKILNYGEKNNILIRPGQQLGITEVCMYMYFGGDGNGSGLVPGWGVKTSRNSRQ